MHVVHNAGDGVVCRWYYVRRGYYVRSGYVRRGIVRTFMIQVS